MISSSDEFLIFPGDGSKFSLKCTRCGKYVTYPESIGCTLSIAPYALLSHLDITLSHENENDVSNCLETLPILFTSHQNYKKAIASFVDSCKKEKRESVYANNTDYEVLSSCVVQKIEQGNFCFVKLLKLMIRYQMLI